MNIEKKFETIDWGEHSGVDIANNLVIDNEEDLEYHLANIAPKPEIDLDKDIVLAAYMGTRSRGGYNIEIYKIIEKDAEIEVHIKKKNPGNAIGPTVMTQPYHIVKTAKSQKPFYFVD